MFFRLSHTAAAFAALLLMTIVGACTPTVAKRGTMLETEKLEKIVVGDTTREQVLELLGSPTQVGTFDEKVWYYVGRTTEQYSFLDPKVVEQKGAEIVFNDLGIVEKVTPIDANASKDISPVARKTPTYGRETTVIEQLIGNLGRPGTLGKK